MGSTGWKGSVFVILNILFWLVGSAVLGYAIWILISTANYNHFLEGTLIFTYSFLGIGIYMFIAGLLGCIGGCKESTCCLKAYVTLMTALLIIDIGVAVAGFVQKDKVFDITDTLWDEINQDTRNQIQSQLECCGYTDKNEYGSDIPSSCYEDEASKTLHTTSCEDAMKSWVEDNIPIWASIIGVIGLVQILGLAMSCVVLTELQNKMRVSDLDGNYG